MRSGGSYDIFWQSPIALSLLLVALTALLVNLYRGLRGRGPRQGAHGSGIA